MTISFDTEADVLYIVFADSGDLECEYSEEQEGIVIRQDPESGRVYGCTITGFLERMEREPEITIPEIGVVPSSVMTRIARVSR